MTIFLPWVIKLCCTCIRQLVGLDPCEEVVKEIRDHEQRLSHVQERRAITLHGDKLEERIEAHELQAGTTKDFLSRHARESGLHDALGMRIAIMTGIAKQSSAPPQQGEIDSPGIYADRIDAAVFLGAAPQRCQ